MTRAPLPRRALWTLVLGLALAAPTARAATWDAIERLPGRSPTTVLVDQKPRLYFRVTPDQPLVVPVTGPARLRVTSRVDFPSGRGGVVAYTVRVLEGTREIERQDTETAPSGRVHVEGESGGVGKSRRMTVDVPSGRHELKVGVTGVSAVLVRLHQAAPPRGEQATVSLTPIEAARSVLVAEGEKTVPYYSVMAGKPVRLRLAGPTSLELITRLDFDASMRGTQGYRIAVVENGRRLREAEFKTTKATTASYTNLKDRVPSKLDRLVLTFAEGTHELLVELVAPAGATAEVHARIPEPVVGGEE